MIASETPQVNEIPETRYLPPITCAKSVNAKGEQVSSIVRGQAGNFRTRVGKAANFGLNVSAVMWVSNGPSAQLWRISGLGRTHYAISNRVRVHSPSADGDNHWARPET